MGVFEEIDISDHPMQKRFTGRKPSTVFLRHGKAP
jgi:hypothetical protein